MNEQTRRLADALREVWMRCVEMDSDSRKDFTLPKLARLDLDSILAQQGKVLSALAAYDAQPDAEDVAGLRAKHLREKTVWRESMRVQERSTNDFAMKAKALREENATLRARIAELESAWVYELRDTSDEEMYHHVGMFLSLESALAAVQDKPWELCEFADESGHARLDIYKHQPSKVGQDAGVRVWSGEWDQQWTEQDEQTWEGKGAMTVPPSPEARL